MDTYIINREINVGVDSSNNLKNNNIYYYIKSSVTEPCIYQAICVNTQLLTMLINGCHPKHMLTFE